MVNRVFAVGIFLFLSFSLINWIKLAPHTIAVQDVYPPPQIVRSVLIHTGNSSRKLTIEEYHDLYSTILQNTTDYSNTPKGGIVADIEIHTNDSRVVNLTILETNIPKQITHDPNEFSSALFIQFGKSYTLGVKDPKRLINFLLKIDYDKYKTMAKYRSFVMGLP